MKSIVHHWRTPVVFISTSHSPYVNLSLENYLFHNQLTTLLLLYRNNPSVIIGRNQNPWMEVDLKYMNEKGIDLVRRHSGGGTVFHDLGNTNYCIMTSRTLFDRKKTLQMVIDALRLSGKHVRMNERYDLVFGPDKLKVSGSAFKISKNRAYQHGTMLLRTNLTCLKDLIKNQNITISSRSVQSIPSTVGNLGLNNDEFCRRICQSFGNTYNPGNPIPIYYVSEQDICSINDIQEYIKEMKQWSWIYGQTPEFTNHLTHTFSWDHVNVHIICKHGLFFHIDVKSNMELSSIFLQKICHKLIGRRYMADEVRSLLHTIKPLSNVKKESIQFLEWFADSI